MIPVKLTVSGFLSYADPVSMDFSSFDLACIAGPNGAGKSSLLDAMTYALFGKARRADETLINLQSDAAFVELIFRYESNLYRVQRTNARGKSTVLEFQIAAPADGDTEEDDVQWKALTERTVRDTQRRIEETLRLDYDTFINASFFLQGKADQFTQQTPSRRKAILGSILGLDMWESYRQEASSRRRGVESEVQALDGRLAEINTELAQEGERVSLLEKLTQELDRLAESRTKQEALLETVRQIRAQVEEQQRFVDTLADQLQKKRGRLGDLEKRRALRTEERARHLEIQAREGEIRKAFETLQENRRRLADWDVAARDHQQERQVPRLEIEKARTRLESEQEDLLKRQEEAGATEREVARLEAEIAGVNEKHRAAQQALEGKQSLEQALDSARKEQAAARAENPRLKKEMDTLKKRIVQLEEAPEDSALCPLCGQPLSLEHRAGLIEDLTVEGTSKGDQYRANLTLLNEADERVGGLEKQIAGFKEHEEEERLLSRQRIEIEGKLGRSRQLLEAWQKDGAARLEEVRRMLETENFAEEARSELARIDAALTETGYDVAEHDRLRVAVEGAAAVEEEMRGVEKAAAALEPLNRELDELTEEIRGGQDELASLEKTHAEAVASLAVSQAGAPDPVQAQRDLLDLVEQENELRMNVGSAKQNVDVLEGLKERKQALDAEREALSRKIARYRQLERAFSSDGVPALLIEQAIPQIESTANELLERLSAGEMSIRFQTQRLLKSRPDLRETLEISISDRAGTRDYEMYSGGEAFRVNFAIRLALSEVLARRAGARLQTLVIDEGFGSQDDAGRQRLVEAINIVREDFAKVLVITHIESLKESFPTRIDVSKGLNGSTVTMVTA